MGLGRWTGFHAGQEVNHPLGEGQPGIVQDGLFTDEDGNLKVPVKWHDGHTSVVNAKELR